MRKITNPIKQMIIILCFIISGFAYTNLFAAIQNPVTMLQQITQKMTGQLNANMNNLNSDTLYKIIHSTIMPYADTRIMGGLVLGRKYWTSATSQQKQQFIKYFSYLVIDTYVGALKTYTPNDKIHFRPLRENFANKSRIVVSSVIRRSNGQNIQIQYYLHHMGNTWKFYDFSIDNISLVQSYNQQFQSTLQQGGLKLLLTKLKSRTNK